MGELNGELEFLITPFLINSEIMLCEGSTRDRVTFKTVNVIKVSY